MTDFFLRLTDWVEVTSTTGMFCISGVLLFAVWLLNTSFGRKSLTDSKPRRNCMPLAVPFIPVFFWLFTASVIRTIVEEVFGADFILPSELLDNIIYIISACITVTVILVAVKLTFVGGLKGFGLNIKYFFKDLVASAINLLAVWPLVLAMIIITSVVGYIIFGENFQIAQHEQLQVLSESEDIYIKILTTISAVVIAPILEELMFRGLFQSVIRSYLLKPWPAIAISSLLFVSVHANIEHWPALFILGLGIGYSYEKSGSLIRPIIMHALFNGLTIFSLFS